MINPYYNPWQLYSGSYPQPIQMPSVPQNAAQGQQSLVWVQGEAGAKSYLVAPGTQVVLMDSEGDRFYLKQADANGVPLPLRTFEYKELIANAPQIQREDYISRQEFEEFKASMNKPAKKNKEEHNEQPV